jgi:hypothetical protein
MMAANSRPEPNEGDAARTLTDHLRDVALVAQEIAKRERIARVRAVRGKYAHVPTSSDAFIQAKQEEIAREDRRS